MLSKHVSHQTGYMRVDMRDGNFDTISNEIPLHLLTIHQDALIYGQTRILLVVSAERHEEYPLVDLACLSYFVNSVFHGMRLAYLNLYQIDPNDVRRRFLVEHRRLSNGMEFEMFSDEAQALDWLLNDRSTRSLS